MDILEEIRLRERQELMALPRDQRLLIHCTKLIRSNRLRFDGYGGIRIRRRELKGRFGSRLFRVAVEALTRAETQLVSLKVTRAGKPYEVYLCCPNCERDRDRWTRYRIPEFPRFALEEWPCDGDRSEAYGSCTGCSAGVRLRRSPQGTWSASVRRKSEYE